MSLVEEAPANRTGLTRAGSHSNVGSADDTKTASLPQVRPAALAQFMAPLVFQSGLRAIASKIDRGDIGEARAIASAMGLNLGTVKRQSRIQPTLLHVVTP